MKVLLITGGSAIGKTTLLKSIFGLDKLVTPKICVRDNLHPKLNDWSYFGYFRIDRCLNEVPLLYPKAIRVVAEASHTIEHSMSKFPYDYEVRTLDIPIEEHEHRFNLRRACRKDIVKSFTKIRKEHDVYLSKYEAITPKELIDKIKYDITRK